MTDRKTEGRLQEDSDLKDHPGIHENPGSVIEKKEYIILGAMFAVLLILILLFFISGGEKRKKSAPPPPPVETEEAEAEVLEFKTVTLFFLSGDDRLFHGEEREIYPGSSLVFEMKQTIEELLKGSNNGLISPFPPETKLREIFFSEDGIAYVDFSREIQDDHISGTTAEVETIYSIVNSLAYNYEEVKSVFILVDGNGKETLKGHIDISRPLVPKFSLIAE